MSKKLTHEEFIKKLLEKNQYYINGDFELLEDYTYSRINIRCRCKKCGHEWLAPPQNLLLGYGCHICRLNNCKISQEEFLKRLNTIHNNIIALDKYDGMDIKIRFQCNKGHVWIAEPHNILKGSGCPYCAEKKLLTGFNDLWTVRPDIASLLRNSEDGYKYTKAAHAKVDFVCPQCRNVINKRINDVYNKGLCCPKCSDGISYPNKFARCFLSQLSLEECKHEYSPDWAKPYFYDNYFIYKNIRYILEMDGGFHYIENVVFNKSLNDRRIVDKIKEDLAVQNGIKIIRIECLKSDCNYIKNNILSSELNTIFDLSDIDWDLCDKTSQKSLVKQACELYSSGIQDLNIIANALHVHRSTIHRYVKIGAKYEWCDYNIKTAIQNATTHNSKTVPVCIIDNDMNVIHKFRSIRECQTQIKDRYGLGISRKKIIESCKAHKPYKEFNFRFANEIMQK